MKSASILTWQLFSFLLILIVGLPKVSFVSASDWGYVQGTITPKDWPGIKHSQCGSWRQSPIDIDTSKVVYGSHLKQIWLEEVTAKSTNLKDIMKNDGHKVILSVSDQKSLKFKIKDSEVCYQFVGIHWHWGSVDSLGSEHKKDGKSYPMEAHMVSWNCKDYTSFDKAVHAPQGLAVFGFFYEVADDAKKNLILESLTKKFGRIRQASSYEHGREAILDVPSVDYVKLMPKDLSSYYRYMGSLTTPNCGQNVMWTVFKETVPITKEQLQRFRNLKYPDGKSMVDNFRPVQPLNKASSQAVLRVVTSSFNQGIQTGGSITLPIFLSVLVVVVRSFTTEW